MFTLQLWAIDEPILNLQIYSILMFMCKSQNYIHYSNWVTGACSTKGLRQVTHSGTQCKMTRIHLLEGSTVGSLVFLPSKNMHASVNNPIM